MAAVMRSPCSQKDDTRSCEQAHGFQDPKGRDWKGCVSCDPLELSELAVTSPGLPWRRWDHWASSPWWRIPEPLCQPVFKAKDAL